MQPYLFPYIGYFQLIGAVDTFVFFDDVNFITRGYIHRNAIDINGKKSIFTVPLAGASQNSPINETRIHEREYGKWWHKFQKTLKQQYGSAPFFGNTFEILNEVFDAPSNTISALAEKSVIAVCSYLGMDTRFEKASNIDYDKTGAAQEKVLDLCAFLQADTYINPIGGAELYQDADFSKNELELYFIKSGKIQYEQKTEAFLPALSIIDVLMYNGPASITGFLERYELLKQERL
jgi:hypothetical protein